MALALPINRSISALLVLAVLHTFCFLSFSTADETARNRQRRSGGGRVGDMCSQNTDCQSGMYCFNGQCTCLTNHVAISSFCWPKVNPGDSGCVEHVQCESVWPGARCARSGICDCPEHYVPAKTRDGTVCITAGVPPACPFPEPNSPEAPSPATLLANPSTHPLAPDSYMPVLCTSSSPEVLNSNGGDGSTWCIYPDGDKDLYVADIYNCVPHPQVRAEYFPEYAPSVDGICCHSRAFVCVQPMVQGEEPSVPRWWYNSVTGTCSQFLWDSSQSEGVSPNNFRSMEHCESYCRDTCRRGAVQFQRHLRSSLMDEFPVSNCMRPSGACTPENACVQIGSLQQCCPTIAHLCSPSGGRAFPPAAVSYGSREPFNPGAQVAGTAPVNRFYYDAEQGRCTNFLFEGGLGNFNNFGTKKDCENFCSKLVCEFGQPLRVAEGQWQRCESGADCPQSHSCDSAHKVCCPTAQTICTQPKRVGECTGSVGRYWYNAGTRQCELFDFTGCQGNDNNFEQLMECQLKCRNIALEPRCVQGRAHRDASGLFSRCSLADGCPPNYECHFDGSVSGCCPQRTWTCSLGPDRGVQCGAGRSFRFYFDADKQSCESFQYEGCDGNANNFQSLESCQDFCGVGGCPSGGQPLRDSSNNQFLACSESQPCPDSASHECVPVNAHGSIAHRCCPTKAHICSQPPQPGNACQKSTITRWYFNIVTRECGKFGFNGCNGNLNNFDSQDQCQKFCSSAACAAGEMAYRKEDKSANGGLVLSSGISPRRPLLVVECSPHLVPSQCPRDFRCVRDELQHRHVCCGSPPSDVCAEGERAYWNAMDETVRECQANVAGSCPDNFLCRFSGAHNKYFCCAPRNGTLCPDGRSLYRAAKTLQPLRCIVGGNSQRGQCPDGYSCQSRVARDLRGHCCSTQEVCRGGVQFATDERSQMPRLCIPGSFSACPSGFQCEKPHFGGVNGVCCKRNLTESQVQSADGCPPGESALLRKSEIVQCDPFNTRDKGCPQRYTCQFARMHQRYQCCAKSSHKGGTEESAKGGGGEREESAGEGAPNGGCPGNQVAALDPLGGHSSVRVCTVSAPSSCPPGFSCQFSDRNAQFQCCAHKAGCPGHSVAFVDSAGTARPCSLSNSRQLQCPVGYRCRLVKRENDAGEQGICCSAVEEQGSPVTTSTLGPTVAGGLGERRERPKEKSKAGKTPSTAGGSAKRKKCKANEQLVDGQCRTRQLGDACIVAENCPPSADCIDYACKCPLGTRQKSAIECELDLKAGKKGRKKGKKGVDDRREVEEEKEEEENEADVDECAPGEVLIDGECVSAHQSVGSRCKHSVQCWWNGAKCISGRCRCTGGAAAYRNKCQRNVCGGDHFRLPQLGAIGEVVQCARPGSRAQRCEWPHRCDFSHSLHTYICCRSSSTRIGESVVGMLTVTAKRKKAQQGSGRTTTSSRFNRMKRKLPRRKPPHVVPEHKLARPLLIGPAPPMPCQLPLLETDVLSETRPASQCASPAIDYGMASVRSADDGLYDNGAMGEQ